VNQEVDYRRGALMHLRLIIIVIIIIIIIIFIIIIIINIFKVA